jgi:hypothetical protein
MHVPTPFSSLQILAPPLSIQTVSPKTKGGVSMAPLPLTLARLKPWIPFPVAPRPIATVHSSRERPPFPSFKSVTFQPTAEWNPATIRAYRWMGAESGAQIAGDCRMCRVNNSMFSGLCSNVRRCIDFENNESLKRQSSGSWRQPTLGRELFAESMDREM